MDRLPDLDETVEEIVAFIRELVRTSNANGLVIGLSGGVDSSLVLALCVRAIGAQKILGLIMPVAFTPEKDLEDAKELASSFGIRTQIVRIDSIAEAFAKALGINAQESSQRIPLGNVLARIRMTILYYYANMNNFLVVGTGDRSENLIGYFTKYGDGGVDLLPIGHLYKTQVRVMAARLGIPERIAHKPSSPQLYPGHRATDEIPIDYDKLDLIEARLLDQHMSTEMVADVVGVSQEIVMEVVRRFEATKHKRERPRMVK